MTKSEADISDTLIAKSLQLNADDIVGGPIVVTITGVRRTNDDKQPVAVEIAGRMPFIPCKTMRRVICKAWGADARQWVGRQLKLYRDPTVVYAGEAVGGIRISAMSHIDVKFELSLSERRGSKKKFVIEPLAVDKSTQSSGQAKETPFQLMATNWKWWRERNRQSATADDLRSFVSTASDGAVTPAQAFGKEFHSTELLSKCQAIIDADMPINNDDVPFEE